MEKELTEQTATEKSGLVKRYAKKVLGASLVTAGLAVAYKLGTRSSTQS